MPKNTAQMWPDETPEQMLERVRAEHGDAIADLVARDLAAAPKRKRQVKQRVGNKERVPAAPTGIRPYGVPLHGQPLSPLGWSGAKSAPKVAPRAAAQRRRST